MNKSFLIPLLALLLCVSCDNKVFDTYNHAPIKGWEKNDTLSFKIPKIQEKGTYSIDLGLRTNNQYPFMALTLVVEQRFYPSKLVKTDTLNCRLTDNNGKKQGQGISYYQYNFHVAQYDLDAGDSLSIVVRHNMKREILPGVSDIGITMRRE